MHIRIVVAVATVLTTSSAYSQTGASSAAKASASPARTYTKAPTSKVRVKTSVDKFTLWVDETKWKQEESDTPGMLTFVHVNSDVGTAVLTDRLGSRPELMRDLALEAFKRGDPNARVISEEKRIVNGRQVLAFEISAKVEGVPTKIFGYSHGGSSGNVEVLGMIPEALLTKNNIEDVTEFLNGLEMSDQEFPSSASREIVPQQGNLFVNSKVSIKYDPAKWTQTNTDDIASSTLTHTSGDAFVKVASGRLAPQFDAIPDIVLSNLRDEDPNARMIFKEKRRVNGVDVWFVKLDGEVNKIPMVTCGYYYAGKSGLVQVVAVTGRALFSEFEKDFMEVLNGLWISE